LNFLKIERVGLVAASFFAGTFWCLFFEKPFWSRFFRDQKTYASFFAKVPAGPELTILERRGVDLPGGRAFFRVRACVRVRVALNNI
jgi:hypothetical protein